MTDFKRLRAKSTRNAQHEPFQKVSSRCGLFFLAQRRFRPRMIRRAPPQPRRSGGLHTLKQKFNPDEPLRCSFCHKTQEQVEKLISSPSDYPRAYICNEVSALRNDSRR